MIKNGSGGYNTKTGLYFEGKVDLITFIKTLPDYKVEETIYTKNKANKWYEIFYENKKVAGSVDEKLQTCDFKRKQYLKLFAPLNRKIEYIYILNDWFKKLEYKDVLDYIIIMGCRYYFNYLPLYEIGLPIPKKN